MLAFTADYVHVRYLKMTDLLHCVISNLAIKTLAGCLARLSSLSPLILLFILHEAC